MVAHLSMTQAQVPQARWSVYPAPQHANADLIPSPADSIYCCIINFSDTACGQAGAEIDVSMSIPPNGDQAPIVNLSELLTTARVIECNIDNPKLTLCSEESCAGGQQWHGPGTPSCINPDFFIKAVQVV